MAMNFDEFKKYVEEHIREFLPKEYEDACVEIREVVKNNDTILSGLAIHKSENCITPTLYLEGYFTRYEEGCEMEALLKRIVETYLEAEDHNFDKEELVSKVTDFHAIKDMVIPRLINRNFNSKRLSGMPYTEVDGDLAVTYHILLDTNCEASIAITNEMFEKYDITVETLHEIAMNNLKVLTPYTLRTMMEVLCELSGNPLLEEEFDSKMWILTNEQKIFGSIWILDKEAMDEIYKKLGKFYILPSSVHECILVPALNGRVEDFNHMIRGVNESCVVAEEVLSDHAYEYDPDNGIIISARDEMA